MDNLLVEAARAAPAAADTLFGLSPPVIAAGIAGLVAVGGLVVNSFIAVGLQRKKSLSEALLARRKNASDRELARQKAIFDEQLAERKFELDKSMDTWRRRVAFAEDTLAAFYEAGTILRMVRSPGSFSYEAEKREGRDQEPADLQSIRDSYWPALKRLDDSAEPLSALHARRHRAVALFGAQADEPFMEVRHIFVEVQVAAQALMRPQTHSGIGNSNEFKEKMERKVWEGLADPDVLQPRMEAAIARAEALFLPDMIRAAPQ